MMPPAISRISDLNSFQEIESRVPDSLQELGRDPEQLGAAPGGKQTHLLVYDLSNLCYIGAKSKSILTPSVEAYFEAVMDYLRQQYRYFRPDLFVFACDHDAEYWRKTKFPAYKAQRLDNEFKQQVRAVIHRIKTENAHLCLEHATCEADDVIYAVCAFTPFRVTIISSDGDFAQLMNERIRVFNPMQCAFRMRSPSPEFDLFEKCIRGDRSDNIPSILPMVTRRRLQDAFAKSSPIEALMQHYRLRPDLAADYARNRELIDLSALPQPLKIALQDKINAFFGVSP